MQTMKRKLNERDAPEPATSDPSTSAFSAFGLDARILQALAKEQFSKPTPIQSEAIPLALQGKDILASARTGTGKTAAYLLPILQSILHTKSSSPSTKHTLALILVPTRELADQISKALHRFTAFCGREIQARNLATSHSEQAAKAQLVVQPDIIIATPARARQYVESKIIDLQELKWVVLDEADLILSYGYEDDFRKLAALLPQGGVQVFLASATLTTEVDELKALICQKPIVLDLQDEGRDDKATVKQYFVKCGEDEKFLLAVALFKLKLITGKCIVFVGDVDRCYRLKMVLDQFGVRGCVLNSELPVNSRIHIVEEFNKNVYDIIIATDEADATSANRKHDIQTNNEPEDAHKNKKPQNKPRKGKRDPNYGVSRGIDFQHVSCVLNFDLPTSAKSYTHRIGRTGRLGRSGIALSFVVPDIQYMKNKLLSLPSTKYDEKVLIAIQTSQEKRGHNVEDYKFDMQKLQGLWYRVSSALKIVNPSAIRQARLKELRDELLKSEKLKRHLEENPEDLKWLRHDHESRAAHLQPHLKIIPDYLVPDSGGSAKELKDVSFVGFERQSNNRIRKARELNKTRKGPRRKNDPLKSFKARR